MPAEITRLKQEGYLPIATFQHFEYYTYRAQPDQERDFREAARAGSVIVSGSQAHQPQALEFVGDALVHYGLGNLSSTNTMSPKPVARLSSTGMCSTMDGISAWSCCQSCSWITLVRVLCRLRRQKTCCAPCLKPVGGKITGANNKRPRYPY